jgi:hypothetical protein
MDSAYYGPHLTKQDYNCALNNAIIWALENPEEASTVAARIYHVNEDSLRTLVLRSKKKKQRNSEGVYNRRGGNNKILNEAQEEAIRQYCYEQWEMGLGASHEMVFAAICHLRKVWIFFASVYKHNLARRCSMLFFISWPLGLGHISIKATVYDLLLIIII